MPTPLTTKENKIEIENFNPKILRKEQSISQNIQESIQCEEPKIIEPARENLLNPDLKKNEIQKTSHKNYLDYHSVQYEGKQNSLKKKSEEVSQKILDKVSQQCQSKLNQESRIEEEFSFKNSIESKIDNIKERKGFREVIGYRAPQLRIFPTSYDSTNAANPLFSNKKSPSVFLGFSPITTPLDQLNVLYRNSSNYDAKIYEYDELRSANMNNVQLFKNQFTPYSFYS